MGNIVVETKRTKRKLSDETKDNDGPQTKRFFLPFALLLSTSGAFD